MSGLDLEPRPVDIKDRTVKTNGPTQACSILIRQNAADWVKIMRRRNQIGASTSGTGETGKIKIE
jgi:hypothetical protein